MSYFNPVLYRFYNTQKTGFYGARYIQIPQITDPSGDTLVLCNYPQTLTNKDLSNVTINTYGFSYVPWTAIVNHSGTWTTNPLIGVMNITTTYPQPASNANTIVRYYYSVQGKNLYLNYYFFQSSAGSGGNSNAYYYKIPSQFHSSLSPMLYAPASFSLPIGTRLGSGRFHALGAALEFSSVYYCTLNGGIPSIVIYREQTQWGPQSSSIFSYAVTQQFGIWFEAIIPLA
jgi:hypothetical protein